MLKSRCCFSSSWGTTITSTKYFQVLLMSFTNFLTGEQKWRKPANFSIVWSRFQRRGRPGPAKRQRGLGIVNTRLGIVNTKLGIVNTRGTRYCTKGLGIVNTMVGGWGDIRPHSREREREIYFKS